MGLTLMEEKICSTNVEEVRHSYMVAIVGSAACGKTAVRNHLQTHHGYRVMCDLENQEDVREENKNDDDAAASLLPNPKVQCISTFIMPAFSDPWWNRYDAILVVIRNGSIPNNINPLHQRAEVISNNGSLDDLYLMVDRAVHNGVLRGDALLWTQERWDRWQEAERSRDARRQAPEEP